MSNSEKKSPKKTIGPLFFFAFERILRRLGLVFRLRVIKYQGKHAQHDQHVRQPYRTKNEKNRLKGPKNE